MARKGKAKSKKQIDPDITEKLEKLKKIRESLHEKVSEYEAYLNSECNIMCEKIEKLYMDRLKSIPEHIRNMTVEELMQMEEENKKSAKGGDSIESSLKQQQMKFEKNKLLSEKKKSKKISRIERKRSLSVSSSSSLKTKPSEALWNGTRILSESSLNTPASNRSVVPAHSITPKFNPKAPLNKAFLRPPRVGEIVMSLSGSPVQNLVDDNDVKSSVAVPLGDGKIMKIIENREVTKLQSDFMKEIDEHTRSTLADAKKKLDEILKS